MSAAQPDEVRIGLLGPLVVLVDGVAIDVTGGKRRGVLARLAMTGASVVATSRLIDDLWSAESADRAVGTLRTYCSQLRRVVGPERLRSTPPGYTLSDVELDAVQFEQLVGQARAAGDLGRRVRLLDAALALWRGPALVEFAEHPWARDEAVRLDSLRLDAQHARFEARLAMGDHHALAGELQVVVANHPLDERFWAQLMLALYRGGRQADALRVFQRARSTLVDELGIEPGIELRELESRMIVQDPTLRGPVAEPVAPEARATPGRDDLRGGAGLDRRSGAGAGAGSATSPFAGAGVDGLAGGIAPDESDVLPPPGPSSLLDWTALARLPFVGRDDELAVGLRACREPGNGLRMVLVEGEPGAGKTRLLGEIATVAHGSGQLVLFGRGDEHLRESYRVWSRVLDTLAPLHPELALAAGEADDPVAGERAEGATARDLPTTGDPDARRQRFFVALAKALAGAADERLVLVLDDLQWADVDSLRALRHVLLDSPPFAMTVLVAVREGAEAPILHSTVAALERAGTLDQVPLGGLDAASVSRLVEHAAAAEIDLLAQRLWHDTGGNALFVTEVLRDRAARVEQHTALHVPESVREIIRERVRALPARAATLLSAAAVVGTAARGPMIGEVAGLDLDDTVAALDEAVASRLLEPVAKEPGVYEFGHAVLRGAILDDVPQARRLDLHRRTALALEQARGIADQSRLAELARHWTAAGAFGDVAAALRYRRLAGEAAARELGYEAAVGHFHEALELLDANPGFDDPVERAEILLAMASTENRAGEVRSAREHCVTAADLAMAADRRDLMVRAALEVGGVLPTGGDVGELEAAPLLHRALTIVDRTSPLYPLVCARLAQVEYWSMPKAQRRELCADAEAAARALDDPRLMATVLLYRYWALAGTDNLDERLGIAGELDELSVALGDLELSLQAGKCRLHALLELGDFPAAVALQNRLAHIAEDLQQPEYLRLAAAFDAMRATVEGRFADADRLALWSRNVLKERGRPVHAEVASYIEMVPKRWIQGRLAQLEHRSKVFVDLAPERLVWWAMRAAVCAEAGDEAEARAALERLDLPSFVRSDPSVDTLGLLAMAAHSVAVLGDRDQARVVYDALLPVAERNAVIGQIAFFGAVAHHLGVLASTLGDEAAAAEHLDAALVRHERMGAVPFVALTAAELARVLGGRAERADRATDLRTRATAIAAELELGLVTTRV